MYACLPILPVIAIKISDTVIVSGTKQEMFLGGKKYTWENNPIMRIYIYIYI